MAEELNWQTRFSGEPGWYWVYQALPRGNGEAYFPVWIEDGRSLPLHASAFYGPLTPPEMPEELMPLEYQEKYRKEKKEKTKEDDLPDSVA